MGPRLGLYSPKAARLPLSGSVALCTQCKCHLVFHCPAKQSPWRFHVKKSPFWKHDLDLEKPLLGMQLPPPWPWPWAERTLQKWPLRPSLAPSSTQPLPRFRRKASWTQFYFSCRSCQSTFIAFRLFPLATNSPQFYLFTRTSWRFGAFFFNLWRPQWFVWSLELLGQEIVFRG